MLICDGLMEIENYTFEQTFISVFLGSFVIKKYILFYAFYDK